MHKLLSVLTFSLALTACTANFCAAGSVSITAGDIDWGANRTSYDTSTNMDYFVFRGTSTVDHTTAASNDLGWIKWSYDVSQYVNYLTSGSIFISSFDVDLNDNVSVLYSFDQSNWTSIGKLINLGVNNTIGYLDYVNPVTSGSSAQSVNAWTTTSLVFTTSVIDALNQSNGTLYFQAQNLESSTYNWGVVIDYATLNLNAVPEPTTLLLFGSGLSCLVGLARRRKRLL